MSNTSISTERVRRFRELHGNRFSKFERGTFVAWDGEGVGRSPHHYILLAGAYSDKGSVQYAGLTAPQDGLHTLKIFDQFFALNRRVDYAIHIGFALGYDVNMWLRDFTREQVENIWNKQELSSYVIEGRKFRILYRRGKMLHIIDEGTKESIQIFDVFPFFQKSFVATLREFFPKWPSLKMIESQKEQRSNFDIRHLPRIRHYCNAELTALLALMEELRSNLKAAQLPIGRWDGPGAVASSLLSRHEIRSYKYVTPSDMMLPIRCAYSGGRIENIMVGHAKTRIYSADLNSAYPAAATTLPSLVGARWIARRNVRPLQLPELGLVRIQWSHKNERLPFYPLFYRTSAGTILYPPEGEGWYWTSEVRSALSWFDRFGGSLKILSCYELATESDERPFKFLFELYDQRLMWKKQGISAQRALKLAANSCYGKLAQQLGGTAEKPPAYFQMEWAGMITAQTRANILSAALTQPDNIIFFATDGIFSRNKLLLNYSEKLGEWSMSQYDDLIMIQNGVYWTKIETDWANKARGFANAKIASPENILRAWKQGEPSIGYDFDRFIGMGLALHGEGRFDLWRTWQRETRELSLEPYGIKRGPSDEPYIPADKLIRTFAEFPHADYEGTKPKCSHPYRILWEKNNLEKQIDEECLEA